MESWMRMDQGNELRALLLGPTGGEPDTLGVDQHEKVQEAQQSMRSEKRNSTNMLVKKQKLLQIATISPLYKAKRTSFQLLFI